MRISWMDSTRGLAILLLLVWHASSIPEYFGWTMPVWLLVSNEVFLPWRMPTLMFLSGVLLERSLRKPPTSFYVGKLRSLLWPYAIWATVFLLMFQRFGGISDPRAWLATGYLWFIFYLLIYYLIAPLITRLPWWVVLPVAISGATILDGELGRFSYMAIFFFAAYYFRAALPWIATMNGFWLISGVFVTVAFTTVSLIVTASTKTHFTQYEIVALPFVLVMIATSIRLVNMLDLALGNSRVILAISWIGRRSVVFYLTHFPVLVALSWTVTSLGVPIDLWVVPVGWVLAVAVGSLLATFQTLPPVAWLFVAPTFRWRNRPTVASDPPPAG